MKLETLELNNFRRFRHLSLSFHPEFTVLAARNGQGKTSVLDAASVLLGPFVGAFDLGQSKPIELKDARYQRLSEQSDSEQVFPVELQAKLSGLQQPISRELNSPKGRTTNKHAAELAALGKSLMEQVRALKPVPLPLVAYYGSGRLWHAHKNISRKSVLSTSRTMGYEDCNSSASSFTQVQQWMTKATYAVLQQQNMEAYQGYTLADQVKGIQNTVDLMLHNEGWSGFHYSMQHEELAMFHPDLGVLPVSLLSDGVRAMVSLVADMAWRCAKLNPQMGLAAQQQTEGVVFIDEVDMHLHPEWQQTVIQSLRRAFPRIQFIATTHSPQVLSTLRRENIRVIQTQPDGFATAEPPVARTYGEPSGDVLHSVMAVDPQPPIAEKQGLQRLTELVDQQLYDQPEAIELTEKLTAALGEQHPQLQRLQRSIQRQKALRA